jgi:predicted Fe-Mo cluster-binding NifX family protein
MKIAIPCAGGQLCMHFGHCQQFAFVDVDEDKNVMGVEMLTPPQHAPGVYPLWVREQGATTVITGGMGGRAKELFEQQGVHVVAGAPVANPEDIVKAWLDNNLQIGENACDH